MAKKIKESAPQKKLRMSYRVINPTGSVPVARPSSNIQLTPIVQPVSFVPYATQAQPMLTFDGNDDYDY